MLEFFGTPPHGGVLRKVMAQSRLVEARRGDILAEAGGDDPPILIVSSGVLCLYKRDPFSGKEIFYAPVFRGGIANVIGALKNSSTQTIRALSHSNVYLLEQPAIRNLIKDVDFLEWCTAQVAQNMESLFQYVMALRTPSVDDRIVQLLQAGYWETHREMPRGDFTLAWPITQNDLAALAGISRPYLNASLKRLEKSGRVRFSGDQVQVSP